MADLLGTGARRAWVAAALIAACRAAQAQQPIDPSDCPRIAEDGERLACYDWQAGRAADATPVAATAAAPAIEKTPPASPLSLNADHPEGVRWYLAAFHGYGETLLDYNFRQSSLGVGLAIFRL